MEKAMTIREIEAQFADEWILIDKPRTDKRLNVLGGRVLHHSRDRDEVYRRAVALRPRRYAVLYTGRMPADTAIVL